MFAIGYHQCRWNYNDELDVANVNENFDKYDIPMDVIWLDIEHTDGKKYFTWDQHKFAHPTKMIDDVASKVRSVCRYGKRRLLFLSNSCYFRAVRW